MPNLPYRKTLLAISIASAVLALSGCNSEDSSTTSETTSTSDTFVKVTSPTGTITGTVTDTDGNFLSGVTVAVAGESTTTDSNGQYVFSDIAVTQTVELDDEDIYSQYLSVSISPGSGYLSATVTVLPTAQLLETSSDDDDDSTTTTTFIDGYIAQAGTAVLPPLTVEASGTLRDSDSAEAISSVTVGARVTSVNGVDTSQEQDGVSTSYSSTLITATTDSDGKFTLSNLPQDSELQLVVSSYDIDTDQSDDTIDTTDYNDSVDLALGNLYVTEADTSDSVAPYVSEVDEVIAQSASTGMLNDDVTNTLTITFSEDIDSDYFDSDDNSVVVRNVDDSTYETVSSATLSDDVLTITLEEDVVEGNTYNVLLLKADLLDLAGNAIETGSDVGYDSDLTTSTGSEYLKLTLQAYEEANQDATSPDLAQTETDDTGSDDLELIQQESPAFNDVDDTTGGIQQLNDDSDDDEDGNYDAADRLEELVAALADTISSSEDTIVTTNVARIEFTATNASYYVVDVADSDGTDKTSSITYNVLDNATWGSSYDFTADEDEADIAMVMTGVVPGDVVTITPYDDFGYAGTAASLELEDNVPPTTILQTAYGTGDSTNSEVVSLQYGDGGEQASLDDATVGLPYFDLTPRLLGEVDGTGDGDYENNLLRLYEYNATNPSSSNNTVVDEGEYFIDPDNGLYDATAYADFIDDYDLSRTVGVAFSEDVTLTDTDPTFTEVTSTDYAPSNFEANNDVLIDDSGDTVNADLVQFDISDIYSFAMNESGSQLDFSDAVEDSNGNVAASTDYGSPSVIFRDEIPALVTSAVYNGREFVITFDKAIDLDEVEDLTTAMDLNGLSIDLSDEDDYDWDSDTYTLTVDFDAYGEFDIADVFSYNQYDDYNSDNLGEEPDDSLEFAHGALDFSNITSSNGASWAYYNDLSSDEGQFDQPTFAAVNILKDFDVSTSTSGTSTLTLTYTFTHEVYGLDTLFSGYVEGGTTTLTSTEISTLITYSGSSIATAYFIETKQDDGSVKYKFVMTNEDGAFSSDETILVDFSTTIDETEAVYSKYDNSLTLTMSALTL